MMSMSLYLHLTTSLNINFIQTGEESNDRVRSDNW